MNNLPPDIDWRLKMITAGGLAVQQSTTFPLTQGADYQMPLICIPNYPMMVTKWDLHPSKIIFLMTPTHKLG